MSSNTEPVYEKYVLQALGILRLKNRRPGEPPKKAA